MKERFRPTDDRSLMLRTHCQTSGWSLAAQDPFNNIVRTVVEAMAATQGHTQSLHTNALDEALALPTDFSARIARNTQLYLQKESGTTRIIDPWGGSYHVERLTDELARKALGPHRRDRCTGRHGQGDRGRRAADAHRGGGGAHAGAARRRPSDRGRRQPLPPGGRRADRRAQGRQFGGAGGADRQAQGSCAPSATAPQRKTALAALTDAARTGTGNLLALAIDAARAKATVGEISLALERAFGRYETEAHAISGTYARDMDKATMAAGRRTDPHLPRE